MGRSVTLGRNMETSTGTVGTPRREEASQRLQLPLKQSLCRNRRFRTLVSWGRRHWGCLSGNQIWVTDGHWGLPPVRVPGLVGP